MVMLAANTLSKQFHQEGHRVLSDISFQCQQGESVVITGCSGSGKSTLLHCLADLEHPTSGEVHFLGKSWSQFRRKQRQTLRAQHIGFIFQFHYLLSDLTALENMVLAGMLAKLPQKDVIDKAKALMDKLGMQGFDHHPVLQLSGGQRQRIAIARALIHEPTLVMADEPTGSLDRHHADAMMAWLLEDQKKRGSTLLVSTHDLSFVEHFDRHFILKEGRLHETA